MQTSPGWLPQGNKITSGDIICQKPTQLLLGLCVLKYLAAFLNKLICEMENLRTLEGQEGSGEGSV